VSDDPKSDEPRPEDAAGQAHGGVGAEDGKTSPEVGPTDMDGAAEELRRLMAEDHGPDLDAKALRAAEEAVAKAEAALATAQLSVPAPTAEEATGATARDWVLRVVLIANLVLLGVMLAMPDPVVETTAEPQGGQGHPERHGVDTHAGTGNGGTASDRAPAIAPGPKVPAVPASSPEFLQAIRLAAADQHADAAELLRRYLDVNPGLPAKARREYLSAMMFYYGEAGMHEEEEACFGRILALQNQSYLPEDVLRLAREADDEGDAARMRQLYARFLLTEKNHSLEERRAVAEAYLKLGDSYRMQAERAKVRAIMVQRERESRLRLETRERRARKEGR